MRFFRKRIGKKRVGLALGGGAVLGAAHIGVLKAIEEFDLKVHCIAGTSIGAFISSLFAFGKGWAEIEEITRDLKWLDVSGLRLSKLGLLSNRKLGDLINEVIGDVNIEEADIPLAVIATDITSGEKVVFKDGSVASAVMASSCIPGIFIPVEIDDRVFVDGGVVENVPISPLAEMGAEIVIGVDLNAKFADKKPENIVEVLLRSFEYTLNSVTALQTAEVDVLIKPDLSLYNMAGFDQTDDLIETGYTEAKRVLGRVL